MRKLFSFMVTTLDGYHTGPDGEFDWPNVDGEFHEFSIRQMNDIDTLLFGRVTYEHMAQFWPSPEALETLPVTAGRMNSVHKVVFSSTLTEATWENSELVTGDPVAKATSSSGGQVTATSRCSAARRSPPACSGPASSTRCGSWSTPSCWAAACPCSPGSPAGSRCGSPAPSRSATATCCSATHPKRCSRAPDMSGPDVLARRVLPSPAMLWAMRAEDEFAGSAVCTAWQHLWPFDRAVLTIAHDWIDCERPSGRRTFRRREDGAVVTLVPYRYVPFLVRSLIWIDQHQRDGFVPFRARAVRRSLAAHGWEVEPETRSWISWVGRLWGRSAANRRVAR